MTVETKRLAMEIHNYLMGLKDDEFAAVQRNASAFYQQRIQHQENRLLNSLDTKQFQAKPKKTKNNP